MNWGWEKKCGELEWEEDGEPGVGMERGQETVEKFNNKDIFKKWKELKVRGLFTKSLKRAELLTGCWTLNEGTRGHSTHLHILLQRERSC